MNLILFDRSKY